MGRREGCPRRRHRHPRTHQGAAAGDPLTPQLTTRKGLPDGDGPAASVTSLSDRRLAHLPPDNRPLPSVAHYDQLLTPRGRTAGDKEGS